LLAVGLKTIRRWARRLVWLNPLLSRPDFAPVSQGMQVAAQYVDLLAPGADLASMERLLPDLIEALR